MEIDLSSRIKKEELDKHGGDCAMVEGELFGSASVDSSGNKLA
jgi:hypothetical protein